MPLPLGDVLAALTARYPVETAADWDAPGLVCGNPEASVSRVLFAVDVVDDTVAEAIETGVDLLVTHHPLFLDGVHGVPADDPKGRLVHRMIRAGVANYAIHTNADVAWPGVSDALATAIGLVDVEPLGTVPGIGRRGRLAVPESLADFAHRVIASLPQTAGGVRVAGDLGRSVVRIAVCGGAGGALLPAVAAAGVDAFVTSDLSHHRALDSIAAGGPALLDIAHWATEWPWLAQAAGLLRTDLGVSTVEIAVSSRRTDPWTWQGSIN
jgi:dinuclear metal center YbgI/SA1388 family protein